MSCWESLRKKMEDENKKDKMKILNKIKKLEATVNANFCYIQAILENIEKEDEDKYVNILKSTSLKIKSKFMEELEQLPIDKQEKILRLLDEGN